MADRESRVRWPNGISLSVPAPSGRIGGTYYFDPGSPTAPHVTLTRTYGVPGAGLHAVFLRDGMTSSDTLGHGVTGNVSTILPSVTLNGTLPHDGNRIPRPWNARVTSVEGGIGTPNASPAVTDTYTPQQISDYIFTPAMGPQDELSPFARSLQSRSGTIGPNTGSSIPFLSSREQNPLGDGMSGWSASAGGGMPAPTASPGNRPTGIASRASADAPAFSPFGSGAAPIPFPPVAQSAHGELRGLMAEIGAIDSPRSDQSRPGGLLGLIEEYMRNNDPSDR